MRYASAIEKYSVIFKIAGKKCPMCRGKGEVGGHRCIFGKCENGYMPLPEEMDENTAKLKTHVRAVVVPIEERPSTGYKVTYTAIVLENQKKAMNQRGYEPVKLRLNVANLFDDKAEAEEVAKKVNDELDMYSFKAFEAKVAQRHHTMVDHEYNEQLGFHGNFAYIRDVFNWTPPHMVNDPGWV